MAKINFLRNILHLYKQEHISDVILKIASTFLVLLKLVATLYPGHEL